MRELDSLLSEKRVGLVAHYYMDPELQVGYLLRVFPIATYKGGMMITPHGCLFIERGLTCINDLILFLMTTGDIVIIEMATCIYS